MRTWGLVSIAVNYTHVRGALLGAPGTLLQQGASPVNAFRAHAAVTVLARLRCSSTCGASPRTVTAWEPSSPRRSSPPFPPTSAWRHTRPVVSCWMPSTARACRCRAWRRPGASRHRISGTTACWTTPSRSSLDRRFDSVLTAPHEGHLYRRPVTPSSPPIPRCCRASGPGTPPTECSSNPWGKGRDLRAALIRRGRTLGGSVRDLSRDFTDARLMESSAFPHDFGLRDRASSTHVAGGGRNEGVRATCTGQLQNRLGRWSPSLFACLRRLRLKS